MFSQFDSTLVRNAIFWGSGPPKVSTGGSRGASNAARLGKFEGQERKVLPIGSALPSELWESSRISRKSSQVGGQSLSKRQVIWLDLLYIYIYIYVLSGSGKRWERFFVVLGQTIKTKTFWTFSLSFYVRAGISFFVRTGISFLFRTGSRSYFVSVLGDRFVFVLGFVLFSFSDFVLCSFCDFVFSLY